MIKNDQIKSIGGVEIDPNFGTVPPQDVAEGQDPPQGSDAGGARAGTGALGLGGL